MQTTARQIMLDAMNGLQSLANNYATLDELFDAVARQSGVSKSMITKIYYGEKTNPSVRILDMFALAVKQLEQDNE